MEKEGESRRGVLFEKYRGSSVLVVDDDPAIHDILNNILDALGMKIISAENGEEGVLKFQQQKPMMVISDLYMPKKNGLMLAREIQQQSTLTPVIIMTGSISENAVIFSPEAHITTVLMKPFKLVDVIEALYKALLELEKGIMEAELKQKAHYTKR